MTAEGLIKELQKYPPETKVVLGEPYTESWWHEEVTELTLINAWLTPESQDTVPAIMIE